MSLFKNLILDTYRNDVRIVSALKGIILLNLSEFNAWFAPVSKKSLRIANVAIAAGPEEEKKMLLRRQTSFSEKETISKSVLEQLATTVCLDPKSGQPAIGDSYGRSAIRRLADSNFDIIVAIETTPIPVGATETVSLHKLSRVVGFIIAELGECKMKPDVWSVNLICGRTLKNGSLIKGAILLGAFVYCIKNSKYTQEGVLELAGGYNNMNGFITYTKMGFNKDLSLFGSNCFDDFNNLPMSCNISTMNNEMIINRAGERERRIVTSDDDDSGLYSSGKIGTLIQNRLILCNDLLYRIHLDFNNISNDPNSLSSQRLVDKFNALNVMVGNNKNRIIQELTNERSQILREIAPVKKNCIQECIEGICKCIGWSGGKYKTRKAYNKSYHNKLRHNKSRHNKSRHNKSHYNKSHRKRRHRNV